MPKNILWTLNPLKSGIKTCNINWQDWASTSRSWTIHCKHLAKFQKDRSSPFWDIGKKIYKKMGIFPKVSVKKYFSKKRHCLCHFSPEFSPKSGFSKEFCLGRSHFLKCLGRKGFGKGFEFSDFCLGRVSFLTKNQYYALFEILSINWNFWFS